MSSTAEGPPRLDWREFLCGWGAAFINVSVTFPINKVRARTIQSRRRKPSIPTPLPFRTSVHPGLSSHHIIDFCFVLMAQVMFRQMLHGMHTLDALRQLRSEGFHYLYRGILPPLCQKTVRQVSQAACNRRIRSGMDLVSAARCRCR